MAKISVGTVGNLAKISDADPDSEYGAFLSLGSGSGISEPIHV
jgi:hypothetical protein